MLKNIFIILIKNIVKGEIKLSNDLKNSINDYSIDYRDISSKNTIKNKPISQKVIAKPNLKLNKSALLKNKYIEINKKDEKKSSYFNENFEEIYINLEKEKPYTLKIILISTFILTIAILGIIIMISNLKRTVPKEYYYPKDILNSLPLSFEYDNYVLPITISDFEPFSNIEDVQDDKVIESAIWKVILKNGVKKYNKFDEEGHSLISLDEIEDSIHFLFGKQVNINFSNEIEGSFFTFSPADNNFHIKAKSKNESYFPYIKEILNDENFLILDVGCVKSRNEKTLKLCPEKLLRYKLKKNNENSNYYVYSLNKIY